MTPVIDAGEGPADGGLGPDLPVGRAITAGAERGPDRLWGVGGPFGDRSHRARARQHGRCGQGQDRDQRVAAPARVSRIIDLGQVGQQMRCVDRVQWLGAGKVGQGGWDRG
jgi:hypothetical protein